LAQRNRIVPWIPVMLWIGVIVGLGSNPFQHEETSRLLRPLLRWLFPDWSHGQIAAAHALVRRSAHVVEYAIAAVLTYNALIRTLPTPSGVRLALGTLAVVALVAAGDELRQMVLPDRTGSLVDVGLDLLGGVTGLALAPIVVRRPPEARDG